jgi:hypothetical protein
MRSTSVLAALLLSAACSNTPAQAQAAGPSAPAAPGGAPAAPAADSRPGKAHAEGQGYVVDVRPPEGAQVGSAATAKVVLHPTGGYHVNKEFPITLAVVAPTGVDLPKVKQTAPDAAKLEEGEAIFEVPFTAKEAGDKAFAATFRFAVCTPTTCDPKNEKLAWNVAVK